ANRIEELAGWPGGDEDLDSGQVAARRELGERLDNLHRLGQSPGPDVAGREQGPVGPDPRGGGVLPQRSEGLLGEPILVHRDVHRRRQKHRTPKSEQRGGDGIVRLACSKSGQKVGGGGGDDVQLRPARQMQVTEESLLRGVEVVRQNRIAREGHQGERRNELLSGLGHRHPNFRPGAPKLPNEISNLVGCDSPAHAHRYALSLEGGRAQPYSSAKGWMAWATASSWRASESSEF